MKDVLIAGYARSPFHFANRGELIKVRPDELAAQVVRGLIERSGIDRREMAGRGPQDEMDAGQDRIVDNARALDYFEGLGSLERNVIEYPKGHHTLEFEPDPSRYALDLAAWLDRTIGKEAGEDGESPWNPPNANYGR